MEWPFRRFVKAFDAFQRRTLCEEMRQRRTAHVAALYANTNYDSGEDNPRGKMISELEDEYERVMAAIWNGTLGKEDEETEEQWNSDFMRAGRRALAATAPPELPGEAQIASLPE